MPQNDGKTNTAQVDRALSASIARREYAKSAARFARAKGAHDELIAKAHRAQADALEIEAMAKRRLADEYDAAQERGEVRSHGERRVSQSETVGFADIGLSGKDIHEARQIRDAEEASPGIVRQTLDAALDAGEEPSKAVLRRATTKARPQLSPAGRDGARHSS